LLPECSETFSQESLRRLVSFLNDDVSNERRLFDELRHTNRGSSSKSNCPQHELLHINTLQKKDISRKNLLSSESSSNKKMQQKNSPQKSRSETISNSQHVTQTEAEVGSQFVEQDGYITVPQTNEHGIQYQYHQDFCFSCYQNVRRHFHKKVYEGLYHFLMTMSQMSDAYLTNCGTPITAMTVLKLQKPVVNQLNSKTNKFKKRLSHTFVGEQSESMPVSSEEEHTLRTLSSGLKFAIN
jgi:hypothetical protein